MENFKNDLYRQIYFLVVKHVDGERLTLTQVQRSDMGGYLCIASNGVPPSVSKRYDVQVNCKYESVFFIFLFYFMLVLYKGIPL